MSLWFEPKEQLDVAISSRVRLARNIKNIPFPSKMTLEQFNIVNEMVRKVIAESEHPIAKTLKYISMNNVPEIERFAMVERHIISERFALNYKNRAIIISEDESICIMLGEEDHIRIQVLLEGLQLERAYEIADMIDSVLCSSLEIAFDERIGFLTECPTNLGTGLRASVMLHLPITNIDKDILNPINRCGCTIRGMYGEGTKALASLYQVSNQITLGISEKSAIENVNNLVNGLIEKEKNNRKFLIMTKCEDLCMRSYGILKNARILTSKELMSRLSNIQLAISLNLLKCNVSPIELIVKGQPYMIMKKHGEMSPEERDMERANLVRNLL